MDLLNISLRVGLSFLLIILIMPIVGRKPVSSLIHIDLLFGLIAANMIGLVVLGVVNNLAVGITAIALWFILIGVTRFLIQKSKWFHDHIYGKEIVIIKEGKIMEENLHYTGITGEELLSQLRRKSVFQLADVEFAVMEANGDISVLTKRELQPLKPKDLRINVSSIKEPQTVMMDGNMLDEPLASLGLNRKWLKTELDKIGVAEENVFLSQVDSMGELYIDLFDDSIMMPKPSTRELLLAQLQKVEADFISYSLETENKKWKEKYLKLAEAIKEVEEKLEPHLMA
ncbi:DUF421 domain-containing protein [Alkaliphilus serpentinus]|uniref:DUF421 domain-containing protein n=1 Tax=Alkaliphilus serpentinus TaxID=1482731 RepID=A0A833HR02_9FIRM|nr:DUF421 domain-containing protein [Alkaliphilus serpentinus]KAB3531491.1 DUF421 domain-containing protein [Alkaliphilus serpentinus]